MTLFGRRDELALTLHARLGRAIFGRSLPFETLPSERDAPFGAVAVLRVDPDIGIMSVFAPKPEWHREGSSEGGLLLVRPANGRLSVRLRDRDVVVGSREAVVLLAGEAASFRLSGVDRLDAIEAPIPRNPDGRSDSLPSMRHLGRDNAGLRVLGAYGAALLRGLVPLPNASVQDLVRDHLHSLVHYTLTPESDVPDTEEDQQDRQTLRLRAIKADVEVRLGRRDLSIELLARLHGITPRYVQQLFKLEEQTFSGFVLERRLIRAMQFLRDSGEERPIGAIAYEVGFGDLSYFNRTFRQRFGRTPSAARRSAEEAEG